MTWKGAVSHSPAKTISATYRLHESSTLRNTLRTNKARKQLIMRSLRLKKRLAATQGHNSQKSEFVSACAPFCLMNGQKTKLSIIPQRVVARVFK